MWPTGQLFIVSEERIVFVPNWWYMVHSCKVFSTFTSVLLLAFIMYSFNPFLTSGLVHLLHLNESISSCRGSG